MRTIALLLGAAAYQGSQRAVAAELARAITHRGCYRGSAEQLTPVLRDPPGLAALAFVVGRALASPRQATQGAHSDRPLLDHAKNDHPRRGQGEPHQAIGCTPLALGASRSPRIPRLAAA